MVVPAAQTDDVQQPAIPPPPGDSAGGPPAGPPAPAPGASPAPVGDALPQHRSPFADYAERTRGAGLLQMITGGGVPALRREVAADWQRKQADIKMYEGLMKQNQTLLMYANRTKSPDAPLGLNYATGKPATQQDIDQWNHAAESAMASYSKLTGVSKNAKGILGKMKDLFGHLTGQQGKSAIPAPPEAVGGAGGGGASGTTGGGALPAPPSSGTGGQSALPAPPGAMGMREAMGQAGVGEIQAQEAAQRSKTEADIAKTKGEEQARADVAAGEPKQYLQGLVEAYKSVGMSDEQAKAQAEKVFNAKFGGPAMRASQKMHPVTYTDPNDPTRKLPGMQSMTPDENGAYPVYGADGQVVANPGSLLPSMLPTRTGSTSSYSADTGVTTTGHTSQKVLPGGGGGAGTRTGGRAALPPPGTSTSAGAKRTGAEPKPTGRVAAMAQDWATYGNVPSAKDRPQVEKYMREHNMQPMPELTTQAAQLVETAEPIVDEVDRLVADIDRLGLAKNNTPGYLLKERAKYAMGIASPEGTLGHDIAALSLGRVVEAAAALKGASRSLHAFTEAEEHTPNTWKDSPAQLRDKLLNIKQRMQDGIKYARLEGRKRGTGIQPPPADNQSSGAFTVETPAGTFTFKDQASADAFKKEAGIK